MLCRVALFWFCPDLDGTLQAFDAEGGLLIVYSKAKGHCVVQDSGDGQLAQPMLVS